MGNGTSAPDSGAREFAMFSDRSIIQKENRPAAKHEVKPGLMKIK